MAISEKDKNKVIAMLEADYHEREIITLTDLKAPAIKSIKKDWDKKKNSQHIADLGQKNEVAVLSGENILKDAINILKIDELDKERLMVQVNELTEGLKGLSILNSSLQVAAIKVTQTIIHKLNPETTSQEVFQLSSALAKINDTFFNPNSTNINILNQGETNINGGKSEAFSEYMRN